MIFPMTPLPRSKSNLYYQLASLFDSLPSASPDNDRATAPLRTLPSLIATFQLERGLSLLNDEEMNSFEAVCQDNEGRIGVSDLVNIIESLAGFSTPGRRVLETSLDAANTFSTSLFSDSTVHGSPARRRRSPSFNSTPPQSPIADKAIKRRFFKATTTSQASPPSSPTSLGVDITESIISLRGTALGVHLDGTLGRDWDHASESHGNDAMGGNLEREGPVIMSNSGLGLWPTASPTGESSIDSLDNEQCFNELSALPTSSSEPSLTLRQRSLPLNSSHAISSSAASRLRSPSGLRSRPIAPARSKRASLGRSLSGLVCPTMPASPSYDNINVFALSPSHSQAFSADLSTATLSRSDSTSSSLGHAEDAPASPPARADNTSHHPRPAVSPAGNIPASPSAVGPFSVTSLFLPTVFLPPGSPEQTFMSLGSEGTSSPMESRPGSYSGEVQTLRELNELAKKLRDAEARLAASSNDYEQDHSELEGRLNDARAELHIKRREEKELRTSERRYLDQIQSLELDVTKAGHALERSRESYSALKKNYEDQLAEAESLRNLIVSIRQDNCEAEDVAQTHSLQISQYERDFARAQATIVKLESETQDALREQDQLEDQKQNNLQLRETIDRLHFDLEELRNVIRHSGSVDHSRGTSVGLSVSSNGLQRRTLGMELEERTVNDGHETAEDDVETIVTTRRIIRVARATDFTARSVSSNSFEAGFLVSEGQTQSATIDSQEMAVQTDIVSILGELQMQKSVTEPPRTKQSIQEELAQGLGVEWSILEGFIEGQKRTISARPSQPSTTPNVVSTLRSRRTNNKNWSSQISSRLSISAAVHAPFYFINAFPQSTRPYVSSALASSSTLVLYTLLVYISGFMLGSHRLPAQHHQHYPAPYSVMVELSDRALWSQYNTLSNPFAEDFTGRMRAADWVQDVILGGVNVIRRVPV